MNFVFVSYDYDTKFESPEKWLKMIEGYAGILEQLGKKHAVTRIQQMRFNIDKVHNGVQFRFVNYGTKSRLFPTKLNRLVRSLNPDIVVVHGLHNPLQVMQLRLQLNKRIKVIAQNHAEKPATGLRKLAQKIADRYIDAYFFASREMGIDWVRKGNLASPEKIHEVMEISSGFYPVEKPSAKARIGLSGQPVFLWVGRLDRNKDPLNVVNAFLQFAETYPQAQLYMIYHTDELLGEIQKALANHIHGNAITMVGKVAHDELLYWYNSADFVLSGSHYEGSGTAVCEAMSCGCVPVVTDIFSFRMITDNGHCGILYEAGNQQAMLSALMQTQQINAVQKRENVLAYFQSHLSFEAIARRFDEIATALIV